MPSPSLSILEELCQVIETRRNADPETSYIARRFQQGTAKIAQKMGEEAVEAVIAAVEEDRAALVSESADMLFHWLLLIADAGIALEEVMSELKRRQGTSGLDEKARRAMKS